MTSHYILLILKEDQKDLKEVKESLITCGLGEITAGDVIEDGRTTYVFTYNGDNETIANIRKKVRRLSRGKPRFKIYYEETKDILRGNQWRLRA